MHCSHCAYSDRNISLSTLKSPSFRGFVLLYCYVRKVIRMNSESSLRSELTISSYFLSSCLGVRVLGSKPNQSSRPGNSNTVTTLRCPASVCLQDSKNRENLQINRTATVQQYRYSSIEQFSSISTVYSSCLLYTSPSPRDLSTSRMPSSA